MGAEQIAFNVRVLEPGMSHVPPGEDPAGGHSHATIEEIYFVLEGEITLKLGDEVVKLGERDAVLIPADDPARDPQRGRRHRGVRDGVGQGRRPAGGIRASTRASFRRIEVHPGDWGDVLHCSCLNG